MAEARYLEDLMAEKAREESRRIADATAALEAALAREVGAVQDAGVLSEALDLALKDRDYYSDLLDAAEFRIRDLECLARDAIQWVQDEWQGCDENSGGMTFVRAARAILRAGKAICPECKGEGRVVGGVGGWNCQTCDGIGGVKPPTAGA